MIFLFLSRKKMNLKKADFVDRFLMNYTMLVVFNKWTKYEIF